MYSSKPSWSQWPKHQAENQANQWRLTAKYVSSSNRPANHQEGTQEQQRGSKKGLAGQKLMLNICMENTRYHLAASLGFGAYASTSMPFDSIAWLMTPSGGSILSNHMAFVELEVVDKNLEGVWVLGWKSQWGGANGMRYLWIKLTDKVRFVVADYNLLTSSDARIIVGGCSLITIHFLGPFSLSLFKAHISLP